MAIGEVGPCGIGCPCTAPQNQVSSTMQAALLNSWSELREKTLDEEDVVKMTRAVQAAVLSLDENPCSSTMLFAVNSPGRTFIAHLGVERAYLVHGDAVEKLTVDHSVLTKFVAEGKVTLAQSDASPMATILTACIGPHGCDWQISSFEPAPESWLFLTSTELSLSFPFKEIASITQQKFIHPARLGSALIDRVPREKRESCLAVVARFDG